MRIRSLVLAASLVALPAFAQVEINVQLPTITFGAPPPLVVVQPGVQVVEDSDDEVFFVDNVYWVRRGPRWYRSNDHRGNWVVVDGPRVPRTIVQINPGKYRHYKHGAVVINPPGPGRVILKEERREDRREEHHEKHGKGKDKH